MVLELGLLNVHMARGCLLYVHMLWAGGVLHLQGKLDRVLLIHAEYGQIKRFGCCL